MQGDYCVIRSGENEEEEEQESDKGSSCSRSDDSMRQKPEAVHRPSDESEEHGTLTHSLTHSHAEGSPWDGPRSEKEEDVTGGKMLEVQKLLGEGDLFDLISVLRRLGHFALTIMVTGLAVCAILYQMQHVQSINIFATRDVRLFSSEPQSMSASESGH